MTGTLADLIDDEADQSLTIAGAMNLATQHCKDDDHLRTMLDWAAQLRDQTGRDWSECIDTAMTMYFG